MEVKGYIKQKPQKPGEKSRKKEETKQLKTISVKRFNANASQQEVMKATYEQAKATRAPLTTIKSRMFQRSRKYEPGWRSRPRSIIWGQRSNTKRKQPTSRDIMLKK